MGLRCNQDEAVAEISCGGPWHLIGVSKLRDGSVAAVFQFYLFSTVAERGTVGEGSGHGPVSPVSGIESIEVPDNQDTRAGRKRSKSAPREIEIDPLREPDAVEIG